VSDGKEHLARNIEQNVTGRKTPDNGVTGERAIRAQERMEKPLMWAAVLTLPSVILMETQTAGWLSLASTILNWGTWLAFAVALVVMLVLVPNRWKYLKNHPLEVIIVVLTPPVVPASLQFLRVLRLLRLLRLLKLAEIAKKVFSTNGLLYGGLMTLTVALLGGTLFRYFETSQDLTEWDSIYWAVAVMTTVGSDFNTTTTGAQIVEVVILLVGVTFLSMLTGAIAHRFLNPTGETLQAPDPGEPDTD
jgi:voltage-gated potassium channel